MHVFFPSMLQLCVNVYVEDGCVQIWIRSAEPPGEYCYEKWNNNNRLRPGLPSSMLASEIHFTVCDEPPHSFIIILQKCIFFLTFCISV